MPVFCLFTLGRHGNFTAGVTSEQPDLLCTALALNIELLSINMCTVILEFPINACNQCNQMAISLPLDLSLILKRYVIRVGTEVNIIDLNLIFSIVFQFPIIGRIGENPY
jgi:hypothetical protein